MWELDYKEGWALKNWCYQIVVLEKTLESPLGSKEIKPVYPKGNQPWIFIGRTNTEAETLILWPPYVKSDSLDKTLMQGKIKGKRRKEVTEDEMVWWHCWLNGNEFEQAPQDSEEQESLVCCSTWGHKESDMTYWLNNKTRNLHLSGIKISRNANFGKVA